MIFVVGRLTCMRATFWSLVRIACVATSEVPLLYSSDWLVNCDLHHCVVRSVLAFIELTRPATWLAGHRNRLGHSAINLGDYILKATAYQCCPEFVLVLDSLPCSRCGTLAGVIIIIHLIWCLPLWRFL